MAFTRKQNLQPVMKVAMTITCQHLADKDVTSKSDPCAVVLMLQRDYWIEVDRTEQVKNCLDPKFSKAIPMDYYFEQVQKVQIAIYDIDNSTSQLNDDDFLGQLECTLGQIVSGSPFTKPLLRKDGKQFGKAVITIRAEEIAKQNEILMMTFHAKNLENKDTFGKSDPFLELNRQLPDGSWVLAHRTEVVMNSLNPSWREFQVTIQKLCGGDRNKPIKIDCYDSDDDGSHDLIGSFTATVTELMKASTSQLEWECVNPKKQTKKKYQNSGVVYLSSCKFGIVYTFLDYVLGGMQINFTVGIDFTGSNGDPRAPESLHYIGSGKPNEYMKAIQAIGTVIEDYDSDQMFPALGFGARIPPTMDVSHEFAINFNPSNPFCKGVAGILEAYKMCITNVQLFGPTNFAPIIRHVTRFAESVRKDESARNYFVLLIITDGEISDMDDTLLAIVHASSLPMSIIIVGVGEAEFEMMEILDCDKGVLRAPNGVTAQRDIVQFVALRDFKNCPPEVLAKNVLNEVPQQVVSYYKNVGIIPGLRQQP